MCERRMAQATHLLKEACRSITQEQAAMARCEERVAKHHCVESGLVKAGEGRQIQNYVLMIGSGQEMEQIV